MQYVKLTTSGLLLASFLLFLSGCGSAVPDALAPDLVLYNGKIVTVDEDFSIAQAVAIKSGRFVAVGSDSEILALAGADTERVDLEGKTVLPGFNDSHLHLSWPVGEPPDPAIQKLGKAQSIVEIVELVREALGGLPISSIDTLEDVLDADRAARRFVEDRLTAPPSKWTTEPARSATRQ